MSTKDLTYSERQKKQRELQDAIVEATMCLERAKLAANDLGVPFEFLGRTYTPLKVVKQGGHFDHEPNPHAAVESWDESDDSWQNSGCTGF